MEGLLVLLSVNRSMGEDVSRLGIYSEHVQWILIYSVATYMKLLVCPVIDVKHLARCKNQLIAFTNFLFLNFTCTAWGITLEIILGYGPGSSSCTSTVDKTHRLLLRSKRTC